MIARAEWLHLVEAGLLGSNTQRATCRTRGETVLAAVRDLQALLPPGGRVNVGGRSLPVDDVLEGLRRVGSLLAGEPQAD